MNCSFRINQSFVHFILAAQGTDEEIILMFPDGHYIKQYHIQSNKTSVVFELDSTLRYYFVGYDYTRQFIYWFWSGSDIIASVSMRDTSPGGISRFHTEGNSYGQALDWVHNNLYWTEYSRGVIEVLNVNTRFRTVLVDSLDNPLYIALDPRNDQGYV